MSRPDLLPFLSALIQSHFSRTRSCVLQNLSLSLPLSLLCFTLGNNSSELGKKTAWVKGMGCFCFCHLTHADLYKGCVVSGSHLEPLTYSSLSVGALIKLACGNTGSRLNQARGASCLRKPASTPATQCKQAHPPPALLYHAQQA